MARGRVTRNSIRGGSTLIQRSRSVSPQQKAIYHNVTGAGRSGVIREFFNVGRDDVPALVDLLQTRLDRNVQRGT